jgi:hypothetical protein
VPQCLEVCTYFVGYLEDFEFVAEGSTAAMVEVYADYSADDLLGLEEELKGWAYDRFVD